MTATEISARADFSQIRYAQCWEDADVLLDGLDIRPGDRCLVIASAGDNALAMLTRNPETVVALDLNPAQLFCLELRATAYARLNHGELLELMGSRPGRRRALYARCREALGPEAAEFWDRRLDLVEAHGVAGVGRFERYFRLFRRYVLPLCHGRRRVAELFQPRSVGERADFYERRWRNRRWRLMAGLFFSRPVMGRLGRDPAFFNYVEGGMAGHLENKIRQALVDMDPGENPYLHWILTGTHGRALPLALRPQWFETIRRNLPRLSWRLASTEDFAWEATASGARFQRLGLSDIFEYMSEDNYLAALDSLAGLVPPGGRLLYWNMMVPRSAPPAFHGRLRPLTALAAELDRRDQAFFYRRVVVEERV